MTKAKRGSFARRRPGDAGYTIVEVIMALAVLVVGGMGVVALQKFTVIGAVNARAIAYANAASQSWIDTFQDEAILWNSPNNTDFLDMPIVGPALSSPGTWKAIPVTAESPNGGATPAYPGGAAMILCTQIKADWLGAPTVAAAAAAANRATPTDTVRVDVRTWYAKSGRDIAGECADPTTIDTLLSTGSASVSGVTRSRWEYGFVFYSGTVRRNTLP